jgi:hypothetical protein
MTQFGAAERSIAMSSRPSRPYSDRSGSTTSASLSQTLVTRYRQSMRTPTGSIPVLGALVWAMVSVAGAAAQAPRTCTPTDLSGTETPIEIAEDTPNQDSASTLAVGKRYVAIVIPELAISRDSGRNTSMRDGSARVTGPTGLVLTERDDANSGRHVFAFTPVTDGTLHLNLAWVIEIDKGRPTADACAATVALDVPVRAKQRITTKASFVGSAGPTGSNFAGYSLGFVLPPRNGLMAKDARDVSPVTILVRLRRGTTTPPRPTGKATYKVTYHYDSNAEFLQTRGQGPNYVAKYFSNITWDSTGLQIGCNPNAPRGGLRYAVSVEVRQGGKRVGGMRGGGVCMSERFRRTDGVIRTRARMIKRSFAAEP